MLSIYYSGIQQDNKDLEPLLIATIEGLMESLSCMILLIIKAFKISLIGITRWISKIEIIKI